jgi:hypothetical protein
VIDYEISHSQLRSVIAAGLGHATSDEMQHIRNQIDAAFVFARADFV